MLSWLFNKNPQQFRKENSWPITPLPLWTKPVISKEMIEKIREECHNKELEKQRQRQSQSNQ